MRIRVPDRFASPLQFHPDAFAFTMAPLDPEDWPALFDRLHQTVSGIAYLRRPNPYDAHLGAVED